MINTLQNKTLVISDTFLVFVKQFIYQHYSVFIYTFFSSTNILIFSKQFIIQTIYTSSKNDFNKNKKPTKTLPDLSIFINEKNLSIDQQLFKLQNKFNIN